MDGHIVNKVGTFQIALAANYWGIPYFVTGTPNIHHKTADTVVIEQRDPALVLESLGQTHTVPGVKGYYPAFDVTPPKLCNGVVTDKGVYPCYDLYKYYN
jgi:methylthioribose-1-phosphate isomerase